MAKKRVLWIIELENGNWHTITRSEALAIDTFGALKNDGARAILFTVDVPKVYFPGQSAQSQRSTRQSGE